MRHRAAKSDNVISPSLKRAKKRHEKVLKCDVIDSESIVTNRRVTLTFGGVKTFGSQVGRINKHLGYGAFLTSNWADSILVLR